MKIFHISDLHIGIRLVNHDLTADQKDAFQQILFYAQKEQPDVILIAGDIYDRTLPSQEAVALFDELINDLVQTVPDAEIMMISGNHDSAQRINLFRSILSKQHIHMVGLPPLHAEEKMFQLTLKDAYGPVHFYLLPFVKPSMVREIVGYHEDGSSLSYDEAVRKLIAREDINQTERNVFVSHQLYLPENGSAVERSDSEVFRTVGNIDEIKTDVLEPFDYVALGHIHKPMTVGKRHIRYCGTPFPYSISEANQEKGVLCIDMKEKGSVEMRKLPLTPLHKVRIEEGSLKEILQRPSDDYVRIVLNDQMDLDVTDMMDRIYHAYPNVLEIQRLTSRKQNREVQIEEEKMRSPYELCKEFLGEDLSLEAEDILIDIINSIGEEAL